MPTKSENNKLYKWLDQRLSLNSLKELAEKKKVPLHKNTLWYYMGGIALVLIMIQFFTGILLMFYYVPEINSAYSSVLFINSQVEFGWFFRSMHSWAANILIFVLFLHLFSTYFMKAYRAPRELTWLTGLGLLVLCFGFGFTGYLLPWDGVAFCATKIGLDIAKQVPCVGPLLAEILRGGADVGQGTISRFFAIHVIVLPLALLGLLAIHLLLVQLHGMSEPDGFSKLKSTERTYEPFFPNFVLKDFMVWLFVINVVATIVVIAPWGLGTEADPFAPAPEGIKPEWYFLGMFQFLKLLPAYIGPIEGEQAGLLVFLIIGGVFALAPFLETKKNSKTSKALEVFGIVIMVAFVIFTVWGFVA